MHVENEGAFVLEDKFKVTNSILWKLDTHSYMG
jgi:hypothetical protein